MRFLFALLVVFTGQALLIPKPAGGTTIHILPEPVRVEERSGLFRFTATTKIVVLTMDKEVIRVIKRFKTEWKSASGVSLKLSADSADINSGNAIVFTLHQDPEIKTDEGYRIDISSWQIHISAPHAAGLFYALESLKQMLPPAFFAASGSGLRKQKVTLPCAAILDYPQYPFRGMHLDVSRHFFSVFFIKKYLDILASYKINTFHWHLTDSHGWRLEIKQYPRLTSVGAWRADRKGVPMTIALPTTKNEAATYGGYYTQDQVRDIIEYAKERFISIIPEIEMPGHCEAALVAYPQFNCLNNKVPLLMPCGYPGDLTHNFCVGYDSTFIFLENILTEVMHLFPGPFIHIGGDEVKKDPWETCPRCRQKMKILGLRSTSQLQAYFTSRIDSFVTAHGKRAIGWDDILQSELTPSTAVMSWHGNAGIQMDHDVVMTPYHYVYFDFYQSDPRLEPDITYAPLFLDTVYSFNPKEGLNEAEAKRVLGAEACLWTENISTPERVEYMLLPRLLALSEVLWSPPEKKNYSRLITRIEEAFKRFDAARIRYAASLYNVSIQPVFDSAADKIRIVLSDQAHKYEIHYTVNGGTPTVHSTLYTEPVQVTKQANLKTALFKGDKQMGKINEDVFIVHKGTRARLVLNLADSESLAGCKRLLDGIYGTIEPYDGRWVSFHESELRFTIDLRTVQNLHGIIFRCLEDQVGDIYLPRSVNITASADGSYFYPVYQVINKKLPKRLLRHIEQYKKEDVHRKARYITVDVHNANLFKDEIKNEFMLDEIVVQ